jgi:hypothetical protein
MGGDAEAFEQLYRRHAARVHALAQRFLGPDLADDGTQEVFVRVWQRIGDFRGATRRGGLTGAGAGISLYDDLLRLDVARPVGTTGRWRAMVRANLGIRAGRRGTSASSYRTRRSGLPYQRAPRAGILAHRARPAGGRRLGIRGS